MATTKTIRVEKRVFHVLDHNEQKGVMLAETDDFWTPFSIVSGLRGELRDGMKYTEMRSVRYLADAQKIYAEAIK